MPSTICLWRSLRYVLIVDYDNNTSAELSAAELVHRRSRKVIHKLRDRRELGSRRTSTERESTQYPRLLADTTLNVERFENQLIDPDEKEKKARSR